MISVRHLTVVSFVLMMYGCAPSTELMTTESLSVDDVRLRLSDHSPLSHFFSAEGTITVTTPSMTQSVGFELSSRGTDSIKMSVYGPFGITVGTALVTRRHFSAYNALNNTLYRGSPEKPLKSFPIVNSIPFELFAGALRGHHPFTDVESIDSFTIVPGRYYQFTHRNDDGTYDVFRYDGSVNRIIRCTRMNGGGETVWSVRYGFSRRDDGTVVPNGVDVSVPSKESMLQIEYNGISVDPPSDEFRISYPDDAVVMNLE